MNRKMIINAAQIGHQMRLNIWWQIKMSLCIFHHYIYMKLNNLDDGILSHAIAFIKNES